MRVDNHTDWDTKQLRKLFAACLAEVRKTETHWSLARMSIRVKTHRSPYVGGYAWHDSNGIVMKLPKEIPAEIPQGFDFTQKIADTFIHEIGHCILGRKRKHRKGDIIEPVYRTWILETISMGKFPLEKIETPKRPKGEIVSDRYGRALVNLKKANTRLKRAKTLYDKWNRKVRYYEKKMVARS